MKQTPENQVISSPIPRKHRRARIHAIAFGVATLLGATTEGVGCGDDPTSPTVDENGVLQCGECKQVAFLCVDVYGNPFTKCAPDAPTANAAGCAAASQELSCWESGDTESVDGGDVSGDGADETAASSSPCDDWDPDAAVTYNRSTAKYEIDEQFTDDLAADPSLLFGCDSTRPMMVSGGYFELVNIGAGDLAAQLGLQDGDKLVSVNGYTLQWAEDYETAYGALYQSTSFALTFVRNGTTRTYNYVIQ